MANPTLAFGSIGPYVTQLQEGLNKLPSSLAKLVADGQFGSKTKGRVQEFQSKNQLANDGVVGPLTWEKLLGLLMQGLGGGVPVEPGMTSSKFDVLRPLVLSLANSHLGKVDFSVMVGGRPKGIDFVKEIFQFAADLTLTDINFRAGGKATGAWEAVPWYGLPHEKKSWCGIFAIYCYRKAGIPVKWDARLGGPVGPVKLATYSSSFAANIRPGDIGAVKDQNHHFLIEQVNGAPPAPGLTTLDGNTFLGRIVRRNEHRVDSKFNYYVFTQ